MPASRSSVDLRPAPLDERIARLYYGRRADGKPMASPSRPRFRSPASRTEKKMHELHGTGTIASALRSWEAQPELNEARTPVQCQGSSTAMNSNAFASILRKSGDDEAGAMSACASTIAGGMPPPTAEVLESVLVAQGLMAASHGSSMLQRDDAWRASHRDSIGSISDFGGDSYPNARSPSSLSRPMSACAVSVGNHESPPTEVAFGSGRPQRPGISTYTASSCVPAIGNEGDVRGIF